MHSADNSSRDHYNGRIAKLLKPRQVVSFIAITICLHCLLIFFAHSIIFEENPILQAPREIQHGGDPCATPLSLTTYLQNQSNRVFSKFRPICPDSARNFVHVVIPFYNLEESVITNAVNSAVNQRYPNNLLHIWPYDDGSSDSLDLNDICNGSENVFNFSAISDIDDDRRHASMVLAHHHLESDNIPPMLCFRSKQNLGPGGGKYWLFRLVNALAHPNDIVIVLDGDDILLPGAVQTINQKYINDSAWFTYGSYEGKWSDMNQPLPSVVKSGEKKFTPRLDTWRYGHPRSFKVHLLDHLERTDFTQSDGSWLTKASDRGFVYKMLELSGVDRISYIPEKIYKYNYSTKTSTLAKVSQSSKNAQTSHTQYLKPSSRLELPIHIILLTWKRISLLAHQLKWLQQQTGLKNRLMLVHIVNNNSDERNTIEAIVDNFNNMPKDFVDSNAPSLIVSVSHSDKNIFSCFARFQYVDKLRLSTPLDSVIFVDDDQYWGPTFVSSLLTEHNPRGMTTWYGKIYDKDRKPSGNGKYWESELTMDNILAGQDYDKYSTFKYAGPGGSIIDANLWTFRHQLMRLESDLNKWAKIDDIWLSYVMDALLGWELRRLRPPTVPIDVGHFQDKSEFRNDVVVKLKLITSQIGEQIMSIKTQENIDLKMVGTYFDRSVHKPEMFDSLRTEYRWDIYN